MSSLVQRFLSFLQGGPWRLMLERREVTFVLTAFKGKKSIPLSSLLDRNPPARQLSSLLRLSGDTAVVPVQNLVEARLALRNLESDLLRVDISAEAEAFRVVDAPPDFVVSYVWAEPTGRIQREVGKQAVYCGDGWFVSGDLGWPMPGAEAIDDAWLKMATIGGKNIMPFLRSTIPSWQRRSLPVQCELQVSDEPVVAFSVRYVCDDYLDCTVTWKVPTSAIREIPSLPGQVLAGTLVRPGVSPTALGDYVPAEDKAFRLGGQQIPMFLRDAWPHIQPWASGATAAMQEQHRILSGQGTLGLVVEPTDHGGMSIAVGTPVFACEGVSLAAEAISRQMNRDSEFQRLPGAWVPTQTVRQAGIGPLGRLADGTSLAPVTLAADEVLRRGSERLGGPWTRIDFPTLAIPDGRSPAETALLHLQFLHRWHLPGGLIGNLSEHNQVLLAHVRNLVDSHAGLKILLIAQKKELDSLDAAWVQSAAVRLDGGRRDPSVKRVPSGLVLATPKALETTPELVSTRWDLLCLLAADALIKTSHSGLYDNLNRCQRRLTVGLFTARDFLRRTQARESLSQMFRIPAGPNGELLWRYGLRDPREPSPPLPPPYQSGAQSSRSAVTARQPALLPERPQVTIAATANMSPRQPEVEILERWAANLAELRREGRTPAAAAAPIPPRLSGATPPVAPALQRPAAVDAGMRIEVRYSTGDEEFVTAARKVAGRSEAQAHLVPFQCYWPTYSSMTTAQQRWYFYWRAQVREGRYPDTDLSYIFVHVYELINNVGVRSPDEGYERLHQLWRNYRGRFPKLDRYLVDWMADYAAVYLPDVAPLGIYAEALELNADVRPVDLILATYLKQSLSHLPLAIIEKLCNYQIRRSKFYTEGHQDIVQRGIPAAIESVDRHLRGQCQGGIFDVFNPGTVIPIRRQAFQSARYAGTTRNLTLGTVIPFSWHPPLKEFMTGVVKHAENTLRRLASYPGKLYGYTLEPEVRAAIEEGLGIARPVTTFTSAPRQVEVDLARVQMLISESDEVRDMLLANGQGIVPGAESGLLPGAEAAAVVRPVGTPEALLTDLQAVHAILSRLSHSEKSILVTLMQAGGQMHATALSQALPEILPEAGIDVINRLALTDLGDVLVADEAGVKIIADDYRDELEFLLLRSQPGDTAASLVGAGSQLLPEWIAFGRQLSDHQLGTLEAIIGPGDVAATIRQIAEANAIMPGALLDSINQLAMDTIGDVILDTSVDPPIVEDEDMELVRQLLAATSASQQ